MLNPRGRKTHRLGKKPRQSFPENLRLALAALFSLGSLNPKRRSVQRVGAAFLALGGKCQAGRPFRPPLSTALDR